MSHDTALTDEALQAAVVRGDRAAEETLAERYAYLVRVCARPYFLAGGDSEDLTQEGMLGLISAIREFDPEKHTAFKTFAEQCIKNRLISAVRAAVRLKHTPLNEGVSLDDLLSSEAQSRSISLPEVFGRSPEEQVLARERTDEFYGIFQKCLSQLEADVLRLYLAGYSYREMAVRLHKNPKSVDNAVQRIRLKLAREVREADFGDNSSEAVRNKDFRREGK